MEVPFSARFHFARSGRHPDGTPVGGLRTTRALPGGAVAVNGGPFTHEPVMVAEVVAAFRRVPPGAVLDATAGGGGHARALLDDRADLRIVAVDQDPDAVRAAGVALAVYGDRAVVEHARFDRAGEVLDRLGIGTISGALFDLGVSSPQLDRPERGFSYRSAGPLDMRMDTGRALTASEVVNGWEPARLERLFRDSGESRFARRLTQAIVAHRPVATTGELASIVAGAVPAAARRRGHPARRVFQAVRLAVNEELEVLPRSIDAALARLVPGGRCVVLSYHSGEDRIVKGRFLEAASGGCTCPPGLPCVCGAEPTVKVLTRGARKPTAEEIARNHRAESARLRIAERLGDPGETGERR